MEDNSQVETATDNLRSNQFEIEQPAAQPVAPKQPYTKAEMGKMRRKFITIEHGLVNACGHSFHPVNDPRTNCDDCWYAFFKVHEGIVSGVESIITTFGEKELVKARGTGFVKRYKWFVEMVKAEIEVQGEVNA